MISAEGKHPAKLTLQVESGKNHVSLQARNYYKLEYSALNFTSAGDLNPCRDLTGKTAKVEYFEAGGEGKEGQIVAIELSK